MCCRQQCQIFGCVLQFLSSVLQFLPPTMRNRWVFVAAGCSGRQLVAFCCKFCRPQCQNLGCVCLSVYVCMNTCQRCKHFLIFTWHIWDVCLPCILLPPINGLCVCVSVCRCVSVLVCLCARVPVCLCVCNSVHLSAHQSCCLFVAHFLCLSISLCLSLSVSLPLCLSVFLTLSHSVFLSVCLSLLLSCSPSIFLLVSQSLGLSVSLSLCLSVFFFGIWFLRINHATFVLANCIHEILRYSEGKSVITKQFIAEIHANESLTTPVMLKFMPRP